MDRSFLVSKFHGVFTALITPFKDNHVDLKSLENLLKNQLDQKVNGFVIHGTTGESSSLTVAEKQKVFEFVQSYVSGQVPLIVGTGTNNTVESIENTKKAKSWGADAALVVVPYYNKPPQRGIFQHFAQIAQRSDFNIFIYNVPGRTITSISADTLGELSQFDQIIGIKEATGNIELLKEMKAKTPKKFIYLSGDDGTYVDFLENGGHGVISVSSHIMLKEMVEWTKLNQRQELDKAKAQAVKYKKLIDLLFVESNPIPVKKALQKMGIIDSAELRLPLVEMENKLVEPLLNEMRACGVLK